MTRVRITVEVEGDDLRLIMEHYGMQTTTEAVDLALRSLASGVQPMTREDALALRGAHAIDDVPADVGPLGAT